MCSPTFRDVKTTGKEVKRMNSGEANVKTSKSWPVSVPSSPSAGPLEMPLFQLIPSQRQLVFRGDRLPLQCTATFLDRSVELRWRHNGHIVTTQEEQGVYVEETLLHDCCLLTRYTQGRKETLGWGVDRWENVSWEFSSCWMTCYTDMQARTCKLSPQAGKVTTLLSTKRKQWLSCKHSKYQWLVASLRKLIFIVNYESN